MTTVSAPPPHALVRLPRSQAPPRRAHAHTHLGVLDRRGRGVLQLVGLLGRGLGRVVGGLGRLLGGLLRGLLGRALEALARLLGVLGRLLGRILQLLRLLGRVVRRLLQLLGRLGEGGGGDGQGIEAADRCACRTTAGWALVE